MEDIILIIIRFIVEILGDIILQGIFQGFAELFIHLRNRDPEQGTPWFSILGIHIVLGLLCGAISLILVPHVFIHYAQSRLSAVFIIPLIMGALFSLVNFYRNRPESDVIQLDYFIFAYAFAFSMAWVRYEVLK